MTKMKIDFSQFHPSDHWPGTRRCRDHYGGWRHHLQIAWELRRREQVVNAALTPIQLVRCRQGRHRELVWYTRHGGYTAACQHCPHRRPARADEEFPVPDFSNAEIVGLE